MKNKKSDAKKVEQAKEPNKEVAKVEQAPPKLEGTPIKYWRKDGEEKNKIEVDLKRLTGGFHELTGTSDSEIAFHIVHRAAVAINPRDPADPFAMNVACQSLHDQQPKDAVEARLISQAAALYSQGMVYLSGAEKAEKFDHMQIYGNLAIKVLRLHNETVEALDRHRRGGEQKVTVVHVADKMAVVNNYGSQGGGVSQEKEGGNPCSSQNAEQKPVQTGTGHAANQQWPTGNAVCTGDCVQEQKPQKEG